MQNTITFDVQTDASTNKPRKRHFWFWQFGFWCFMCVVGFFTLILWYTEVTSAAVGHVFMQALIGLLSSLLLHKAFNILNRFSLPIRISMGLILVLATACMWTLMHMQVYVWFTGFTDVWEEFGGWYFSGIVIFLCWTGLFIGVRFYNLVQSELRYKLQAEAESKRENIKRISAQNEARDAKLKMLRYQLNPHFLCNTLNAINSLIEIGESKKAQEMTVQLSDFLRYSLENDPDNKICLSDEIQASILYLAIEKTRFGDRLQINIDTQVNTDKALVPSLLLQPIIENSMKHAIAHNEKGGIISIRAQITDNKLRLHLSDSGQGQLKDSTSTSLLNKKVAHKSVGLLNTKQRLQALYENNHQIKNYFETDGGLNTIITIPLEYAAKDTE